ncbi:MAG: sulfite exporter TauE/SafE family protein [Oscillospiraceae bacterium]|nr:sulfite exporter TauE/SafE family protein [Oscillospiraceae bacterium]
MSILWQFLLAFSCAALSALGMGGGGLLLLYLAAYEGMAQQSAQGINLVFFIPIALVAVLIHAKKGLIRADVALRCILPGVCGVVIGWMLAMRIETQLLSKLFGGFLLIVGVREMFSRAK